MPKTTERFELTGRVAIITGGAGFLAGEFAKALAEAGSNVVLADVREELAEGRATEMTQKYGVRVIGAGVDISKPDSVKKMVNRVKEAFGRIDALVNNAALDPKFDPEQAQQHAASFENYPLDAWQQSLDVDVTGAFLCTQAVAPVMKVQPQGGVIVNISSIYGLVGPDQRLYAPDDPTQPRTYKPPSYSVTKAALDGFTRYLAAYFAGANIRVNTLTFGGVYNEHADEFVRRYSERVPIGRMMNLSEVGGPLLFCVSDASSYMNGANLVVDGGWTAW